MDLATKFSCSSQQLNSLNKSYCAEKKQMFIEEKQLYCKISIAVLKRPWIIYIYSNCRDAIGL